MGQAVYFVVAGSLGLMCTAGASGRRLKTLGFFLWILFQVMLTVAIIVTFVVWLGEQFALLP